ncbi:MAG: hypothetical protein ACHQY2_01185 [Candidatus Eremiobacterales bacterium]|jgi:hypothetical protein
MKPIADWDELTSELLIAVPEFRAVYDEHVRFNGQLLFDILLCELYGFAVAMIEEEGNGADDFLRRLFAYVERGVASPSEQLNTPFVISFLNMVHPDDPQFSTLVPYMLPRSRAEWETYMGMRLPPGGPVA